MQLLSTTHPTRVRDTDSLVDDDTSVTGNVMTGASEAGTGAADTEGADGATVTAFSSANNPLNVGTVGGAALVGEFGTLTLTASGAYTYTQTAPASATGVDVFNYTVTDDDGDTSSTTLTITLDGTVTIDAPNEAAAGTSVSEEGLPGDRVGDLGAGNESAGSNAAGNGETTSGVITFSGNDTPLTLTIDGGQGLGEQTIENGKSYTGTYGVLTIDAINAGSIEYSYTLSDNTSGDATEDSFALKVVDDDGDTASDTLVIDIVDDVPTARADTDSLVDDDTSVTGNVMTGASEAGTGAADTEGADGATVTAFSSANNPLNVGTVGGAALVGEFGTLTLTASGAYTYTQTAPASATGVDVFNYTVTDDDGDTSSTTLTITLDGTVTIDAPNEAAAGTSVSEEGLPGDRVGDLGAGNESAGSNAAGNGETTSGVITFSGNDTPLTLTIDGGQGLGEQTIENGKSYTGTYGVLTIDAINAGSIEYSYTLSDNTSGDATEDSFALKVVDDDGDTASDTLVIDIVDDVPTARADTDSLVDDDTSVTGNVMTGASEAGTGAADTEGADGATVTAFSSANNPLNVGTVGGAALVGEFGTLTLTASGAYTYTQTAPASATGVDVFNYTVTDDDGDTSSTTLTINLDGTVTIDAPNEAAAGTSVSEEGLPGDRVGDLGAGNESAGSNAAGNGETTSGVITFSGNDTPLTLTIDGGQGLGEQTIENGKSYTGTYGVLTIDAINAGSIEYSYTLSDNTSGDATEDSFALKVVDDDGDTASDTLVIDIVDDVPTARADTDSLVDDDTSVTGNVMTGASEAGTGAADTEGADGATVTAFSSANNPLNVGTVGGAALVGEFGTLTLTASGAYTYTQTAPASATGVDVFNYTVTDDDGDTSSTTLTINLDGTVTIDAPNEAAAGTSVSEEGLPGDRVGNLGAGNESAGSNAAGNGETTSGVITFSGNDTPLTLTIDGGQGLGEQTIENGKSYTGTYGVLTIDAINAGSIEYSYTLSDNTSGDATEDSFALKVVDDDGDTASDTLVIDIVDDVPTARADTDSLVDDDTSVTGNVMTGASEAGTGAADTEGADGATVTAFSSANNPLNVGTVGGAALVGEFGTLTLTASGAYTYTQTAPASATGVDVFNYTVTDGDGDTSSTTLTITLDGGVTIDLPVAGGVTTTVSELGLPERNGGEPAGSGEIADGDGTNDSDTSETVAGTFSYDAADVPVSITIGGAAVVSNGVLVTAGNANVITTAKGVLTITGINTTTQEVNYTYTLTDDVDHSAGAVTDDFAVTVSDVDGDSATDTLSINIENDAPDLDAFTKITVANTANTSGTGTGTAVPGADDWGSLEIVGPVLEGLSYVYTTEGTGDALVVVATGVSDADNADVFRFQVDLDGNTQFTLFQPDAGSEVVVDLTGKLTGSGPDPEYTFGDAGNEIVVFSPVVGQLVNTSPNGLGIDNQNFNTEPTLEELAFRLPQSTNTIEFGFFGNGGSKVDAYVRTGDSGTWVQVANDLSFPAGGSIEVTSVNSFDQVLLVAEDTTSNTKVNLATLTETILPEGQELTFTLNGTDGDGDTTTTTVDVEVLVSTPAPVVAPAAAAAASASAPTPEVVDEQEAESEPTVQSATAAADTLLGSDGADVFAWSLSDNLAEGDTIVDFDGDADSISIADLLEDTTDSADYASYLDVSLGEDGVSTVIKVSNTGDFDNAEQTITVQGVNLVDGVDLNDSVALNAALQQLVDAGKLVTE